MDVSAITKLLDRIELWRKLATLPDRVARLEAQVAALTAGAVKPARSCPSCGHSPFPVVREKLADPPFDVLGVREHVRRCPACQFESVHDAAKS